MNFKKIGLIGGGLIGSFLVMMAVVYFVYPYIHPEKKEKIESAKPAQEENNFDPDRFDPEAVAQLNQEIKDLKQLSDSLQQKYKKHLATIDSLNNLLANVREKKQEVKQQESKKAEAKNIEEISKSLLKLDESALAPIVNLLDENQLVELYSSASNLQREKLLRSLKPQTAAKILKKVMS